MDPICLPSEGAGCQGEIGTGLVRRNRQGKDHQPDGGQGSDQPPFQLSFPNTLKLTCKYFADLSIKIYPVCNGDALADKESAH